VLHLGGQLCGLGAGFGQLLGELINHLTSGVQAVLMAGLEDRGAAARRPQNDPDLRRYLHEPLGGDGS
jgi:hypothetical protein